MINCLLRLSSVEGNPDSTHVCRDYHRTPSGSPLVLSFSDELFPSDCCTLLLDEDGEAPLTLFCPERGGNFPGALVSGWRSL
jgi:hypothetical protein